MITVSITKNELITNMTCVAMHRTNLLSPLLINCSCLPLIQSHWHCCNSNVEDVVAEDNSRTIHASHLDSRTQQYTWCSCPGVCSLLLS